MTAPGLLASQNPLTFREAAEGSRRSDGTDATKNMFEESIKPRGLDSTKEPKLEFGSDFKSAVEQAKFSGKPIVLLLTNKDCAWCDAMNKELSNPQLKEMQNRAIFVKLDVNNDPNSPGRLMYNALGAKGFPTTSILSVDLQGNMKESARLSGYYSSSELKASFNENLPSSRVQVAENKDNKVRV